MVWVFTLVGVVTGFKPGAAGAVVSRTQGP